MFTLPLPLPELSLQPASSAAQEYYHPRHHKHMFASYRQELEHARQRHAHRMALNERELSFVSSAPTNDATSLFPDGRASSEEQIALEDSRHPERFLAEHSRLTFRDSQTELVRRLWDMPSALLAECMGGGKTDVILQLLLEKAQARVRAGSSRFGYPAMIVVSKMLVNQWREQIELHYQRGAMSVQVIQLSSHTSALDAVLSVNLARINTCIDLVLTTYDTIKSVHGLITLADARKEPRPTSLLSLDFEYVVLDEGSLVANEETQVFEICRHIKARNRILVSATPFPNATADEALAILDFIAPSSPAGFGGLHVRSTVAFTIDEAARMIKPYLVYVTPPVVNRPVVEEWLSFVNDFERANYQELQRKIVQDADLHMFWTTWERKICISPNLLELSSQRDQARMTSYTPSTKISWILFFEKTRMKEGECTLIFNEHVKPLEEVAYYLDRVGISHVLLHSGLSERARQTLLWQLRSRTVRPRFILISMRLGGPGLDGLQHVANRVIFLQPMWNFYLFDQGCGRIDRMGQLKEVEFYLLIMRGTIEEHMWKITRDKQRNNMLLMGLAG